MSPSAARRLPSVDPLEALARGESIEAALNAIGAQIAALDVASDIRVVAQRCREIREVGGDVAAYLDILGRKRARAASV